MNLSVKTPLVDRKSQYWVELIKINTALFSSTGLTNQMITLLEQFMSILFVLKVPLLIGCYWCEWTNISILIV